MININNYENKQNQTFMEIYPNAKDNDLSKNDNFLYHAIIKNNKYQILERIFKERKILALKYVLECTKKCTFNANDGEYISLLSLDKNQENYDLLYDTYIKRNISLVISPLVNAIKTIYMEFDDWVYVKKKYSNLKNRYSFLMGEYQVKDNIPVDLVAAIGIPYLIFEKEYSSNYATNCIENVIDIMDNYDIHLPIVDTSNNNKVLVKNIKK